jgi:hypothetical protein
LRVYSINEGYKIRLGNDEGDGGYVIQYCPNIKYDCLFSYGVGGDVSFELAFLSFLKPDVAHLFDHTVTKLPNAHPQFRFHKEGMAARASEELDTLEHHLAYYGDGVRTAFLKMDIEGAEYASLSACPDQCFRRISQVILELHNIALENADVIKLLRKLNRQYLLMHVHANNFGEVRGYEGVCVPTVIEITMLNKRHCTGAAESREEFPTALDRPNDSKAPEIEWNLRKPQGNRIR